MAEKREERLRNREAKIMIMTGTDTEIKIWAIVNRTDTEYMLPITKTGEGNKE